MPDRAATEEPAPPKVLSTSPPPVMYGYADSPYGQLILAVTSEGLVGVGLPEEGTKILTRVAGDFSPLIMEHQESVDPAREQIESYFAGERREFDLDLDRRLVSGFQLRALDAVAAIPYGETATYTEIAVAAGSPRAFRAAGTSCAQNPLPLVIPCHRVVASGGGLGGYGGGLDMKASLLAMEASAFGQARAAA